MEITITEYKRCDHVRVKGRIDSRNNSKLREKFDEIRASGKTGIVFDMREVSFLSSGGIRVLIDTQKDLKSARGKLVLLNVPEDMKRVLLDIAGFKRFFEVYDDLTEAVGSF